MIRIVKASAGSGKTYNLAKTYISILLRSDDRYAYRHILAVTFTNKATAEMKNRILKELHILATVPEKSPYVKDFVPSEFSDAGSLKHKASSILVDILHDYGAFSVSTIDKFFQMTLKAFSREIGMFSSYQVELDKKSLVHESVDRILDSLTDESTGLIEWLNEGVKEQLNQGARVNVERKLYEVADRLKSEEQRELSESMGIKASDAFSISRLEAVRTECSAIVCAFEENVSDAASAVINAMGRAGVPLSETNRGFLSQVEAYCPLKPGTAVKRPTEAFFTKAADSGLWFSKTKAGKYLPLVLGVLDGPLQDFIGFFDAPFKVYNTALLLKQQTFDLGLAHKLYSEFDNLLKEKNVLGIDDSNTLLRNIIDGSDAPFVYEKLGVRFENFLLDEFQDTSMIQWQNFRPLLNESDSSGRENLVVGDVKQSIYRWRGSDWHLLSSELVRQFPKSVTETLKSNWRSCANIVAFNNAFFAFAAAAAGASGLYEDVSQESRCSDRQDGQVKVLFCDKEKELEQVLESVKDALLSGAGFGDIAVLVRKNSEGGEVADYLRKEGIPVISDDSLDIKSSVTVRRLVSLLSGVDNPDDEVNGFLASSLNISFPDKSLSLVDLAEFLLRELERNDPELYGKEVLYIQSFMDFLQEWTNVNGNSLVRFLKHWNEKDAPCLSSPDDAAAVRIMTVHKSKGLEFPCVIFPFAETVGFYKWDWHWCMLPSENKELPSASDSMFPIRLTDGVKHTLFSDTLDKERKFQTVDNLNTYYVAFTRAAKSLHIIACTPPDTFLKNGEPKDFSQLLYRFVRQDMTLPLKSGAASGVETFELGTPYDYRMMEVHKSNDTVAFPASFISYSLGDRLHLSLEAADFFGEDGSVGTEASNRLNGLVLHDILSKVQYPSDLPVAVKEAVSDGRLNEDEGEMNLHLLEDRISSVEQMCWFPQKDDGMHEVFNETVLFDSDGKEYRPDRVVISPEGVSVIDYKFGEQKDSYRFQVMKYMSLYRRLGYGNVSGYVWYIFDNSIVKV